MSEPDRQNRFLSFLFSPVGGGVWGGAAPKMQGNGFGRAARRVERGGGAVVSGELSQSVPSAYCALALPRALCVAKSALRSGNGFEQAQAIHHIDKQNSDAHSIGVFALPWVTRGFEKKEPTKSDGVCLSPAGMQGRQV